MSIGFGFYQQVEDEWDMCGNFVDTTQTTYRTGIVSTSTNSQYQGKDLANLFVLYSNLSSAGYTGVTGRECGLFDASGNDIGPKFVIYNTISLKTGIFTSMAPTTTTNGKLYTITSSTSSSNYLKIVNINCNLIMYVVGGGGAGRTNTTSSAGGGGGGGGGSVLKKYMSIESVQSCTFTITVGGGGQSNGANGSESVLRIDSTTASSTGYDVFTVPGGYGGPAGRAGGNSGQGTSGGTSANLDGAGGGGAGGNGGNSDTGTRILYPNTGHGTITNGGAGVNIVFDDVSSTVANGGNGAFNSGITELSTTAANYGGGGNGGNINSSARTFQNGKQGVVYIYVSNYGSFPSSLEGWTNPSQGITTSISIGNPPPSIKATTPYEYAYINAADKISGLTTLKGRTLQFDIYANSNSLINFYFACNNIGAGQMFRLETRALGAGYHSGFASTTSWTSWTSPASGPVATGNTWYTITITISSAGVATFNWSGTNYSYTITDNGTYIGIQADGASGGYVDNIFIT